MRSPTTQVDASVCSAPETATTCHCPSSPGQASEIHLVDIDGSALERATARVAGQLVEVRRVQQEGAHVLGLTVEHLLDEVVEDKPVAAGERVDKLAGPAASVALSGEGGELQACRPALGATLERGDVRGLEVEAHRLVEECLRLFWREPQVRRADSSSSPRVRSRASGNGGSARVVRAATLACGGRWSSRKVIASCTATLSTAW